MRTFPVRITSILLAAILLVSPWSHSAQNKDEAGVKEAWTALQAAVKAKDADKIWALLDSDTQADAERVAKKVKAAYEKAKPKDKAEREKSLGLSAEEFAKLTGTTLIKSKRFHAKYYEIPDSKILSITVQGDTATLAYLELDGDKEKLIFKQRKDKWKVGMPLPNYTN